MAAREKEQNESLINFFSQFYSKSHSGTLCQEAKSAADEQYPGAHLLFLDMKLLGMISPGHQEEPGSCEGSRLGSQPSGVLRWLAPTNLCSTHLQVQQL